jgi:hypothetical protein
MARERYILHQIHPLKLLTDVASGFGSLVPPWRRELGLALSVMLVPPPIASAVVIRCANLERQRDSAFGRYVARTMARHGSRAADGHDRAGGWRVAAALWIVAGGVESIVFG